MVECRARPRLRAHFLFSVTFLGWPSCYVCCIFIATLAISVGSSVQISHEYRRLYSLREH